MNVLSLLKMEGGYTRAIAVHAVGVTSTAIVLAVYVSLFFMRRVLSRNSSALAAPKTIRCASHATIRVFKPATKT